MNETSVKDIKGLVEGYDFKDIFSNQDKIDDLRNKLEEERSKMEDTASLSVLPAFKLTIEVKVKEAA